MRKTIAAALMTAASVTGTVALDESPVSAHGCGTTDHTSGSGQTFAYHTYLYSYTYQGNIYRKWQHYYPYWNVTEDITTNCGPVL